jgi:hypothetical protein
VLCNPRGCVDDYHPRGCPVFLGPLCEPWYRCGPPANGCLRTKP